MRGVFNPVSHEVKGFSVVFRERHGVRRVLGSSNPSYRTFWNPECAWWHQTWALANIFSASLRQVRARTCTTQARIRCLIKTGIYNIRPERNPWPFHKFNEKNCSLHHFLRGRQAGCSCSYKSAILYEYSFGRTQRLRENLFLRGYRISGFLSEAHFGFTFCRNLAGGSGIIEMRFTYSLFLMNSYLLSTRSSSRATGKWCWMQKKWWIQWYFFKRFSYKKCVCWDKGLIILTSHTEVVKEGNCSEKLLHNSSGTSLSELDDVLELL